VTRVAVAAAGLVGAEGSVTEAELGAAAEAGWAGDKAAATTAALAESATAGRVVDEVEGLEAAGAEGLVGAAVVGLEAVAVVETEAIVAAVIGAGLVGERATGWKGGGVEAMEVAPAVGSAAGSAAVAQGGRPLLCCRCQTVWCRRCSCQVCRWGRTA